MRCLACIFSHFTLYFDDIVCMIFALFVPTGMLLNKTSRTVISIFRVQKYP